MCQCCCCGPQWPKKPTNADSLHACDSINKSFNSSLRCHYCSLDYLSLIIARGLLSVTPWHNVDVMTDHFSWYIIGVLRISVCRYLKRQFVMFPQSLSHRHIRHLQMTLASVSEYLVDSGSKVGQNVAHSVADVCFLCRCLLLWSSSKIPKHRITGSCAGY